MESISKIQGTDTDGPAQVGSWGRPAGKTIGFPNSATIAQIWNTPLVVEIGHSHGKQALQNGYSGLYAPAANMHRSPFNGRNYEYYSEDSFLSGEMCGSAVQGIEEMGVYVYIKHFICNDGEAGIYRDAVYTWMTEQALREIYLRPFQMLIEDYDATGLMSSYNRIGAVWAGGSEALLTGVLRDEWGFNGAVITDYADHHSYMQALRRATKEALYMYLHVRVTNRDYAESIGDTTAMRHAFTISVFGWRHLVVLIDIVVIVLFVLAVRGVVIDVKLRKAAKAAKENS